MLGIGPMLPIIPSAENHERSRKKTTKRKTKLDKLDMRGELHELAVMRRPSTIKTESTLIESAEDTKSMAEFAVKDAAHAANHHRDLSIIVDFDLEYMSKQLLDGTISDLDLVLFVYWIKARNGNYVMAKELIRELGLDQGYNVEKVTNLCLRKLLQEIHDIRPRDPRDISTWESPFQSKTPALAMRSNGSIRTVSSPLTARIDGLPPSLRLKRQFAVQEAARTNMVPSNPAGYPPNTPDRPAPLSVRSRTSQASNATPLPNTVLRSASTPARTSPQEVFEKLPELRSSVPTRTVEALSLAWSSSPYKSSRKSTGDVFGIAHGKDDQPRNTFTDKLNDSECRQHGTNERYVHDTGGHHLLGPYQLDTSDIASESSYGTFSSVVRKNRDRASTQVPQRSDIMGDGSFDALESYVGTEDEDDCSLLESASTASEQEIRTKYHFAVQAPSPPPVIAAPLPTSSQRRAAAEAHRTSRTTNYGSPGINFHRPLPLRSYESEATMFPTAGSQANSGRNRAKSVTSVIASRHPGMVPHQLSPIPGLGRTYNTPVRSDKENCARDGSCSKISEQVDQHRAPISQCSSSASTLGAFPIPPMRNPVGELPMLISRATSSPQAVRISSSQHSMLSASMEDTYRAIAKVNLGAQLQRTRAKGEGLQAIEWHKLTSFERAWRELNSVLLVTIYGRADVVLDESDIDYIDCIARELRNVSDGATSDDWFRRIFETDV